MEFRNLDTAASFTKLGKLKPYDIRTGLSRNRIEKYLVSQAGGLTYSYAAMPVDDSILRTLQKLADEQELVEKYKSLLRGDIINLGENRSVLHQLARGQIPVEPVIKDGMDKGKFYAEQLEKIRVFSEKVRSGEIRGSTGKPFDTVCQIGIGGSDLGPRALYIALEGYCTGRNIRQLKGKFISNVDPDDAAAVISSLSVETTLFVLVSKSGTTLETLTNRDLVISAMKEKQIPGLDPRKHMVAVTSNTSPLATSPDVITAFFMDDYIGGRYSATSAVGGVLLSTVFGFDIFRQVLDGAHKADIRALEKDIGKNASLLDALISIYLRNILKLPVTAILPYSQALLRFPAHLQQLAMESNGKHVNRFGKPVAYATEPLVFGEPGTNGQHSFYQLLHQGTDTIPIKFIGFRKNQIGKDVSIKGSTSQEKLTANLCAQIVAFARGKDDTNPNKQFDGMRYSSLLFADQLTPETLGALLAHFENEIMFEGFLWNINSFDQEGVQLGKILATKVLNGCEGATYLIYQICLQRKPYDRRQFLLNEKRKRLLLRTGFIPRLTAAQRAVVLFFQHVEIVQARMRGYCLPDCLLPVSACTSTICTDSRLLSATAVFRAKAAKAAPAAFTRGFTGACGS